MDSYTILNELIAALSDKSYIATTKNLSKRLSVPEEIISEYISKLMTDSITKSLITKQEDRYSFNAEPLIKITSDSSPYHRRYTSPSAKLFPLTRPEYKLFKVSDPLSYKRFNHDDDHYMTKNNGLFMIKTTMHPELSYNHDHILKINKSIEEGATITVTTTDNNTFKFTPHFIKRDINTRQLYVIQTYEDDTYINAIRLDKIRNIKVYKKEVTGSKIQISDKIQTMVNSIWSFEAEDLEAEESEKPVHVKVLIFDETGNILEKMKKDLIDRSYSSITGPFDTPPELSDHPEYYLYEDEVKGLNSFRHWIMQYGRSAIVIEPAQLGREIYESLNN